MVNANAKPPADTKEFIATLPFRSRLRPEHDPGEPELDAAVWRCSRNVCESEGQSPCDTAAGIYYGSAEDEVTKFCPRHYYEMHFADDAAYRLVDQAPNSNASRPSEKCRCGRLLDRAGECQVCPTVDDVEDAFGDVLTKRFPAATTGDLSPGRAIKLRNAIDEAVTEWIENNAVDHQRHE